MINESHKKPGLHERSLTAFHARAILGVKAAVATMRSGLHSFVSTNATARLPALEGTARRASSALVARDLNMSESTALAARRVAWSASPAASVSVCSAMKKALIVDSQTPAYVATPTLPYERTMFDSQVFVPSAGVAGAAAALLAVLLLAVLLLAAVPLVVVPLAPVVERRSLHPRMRGEPQMCDATRVHAARWASMGRQLKPVSCLQLILRDSRALRWQTSRTQPRDVQDRGTQPRDVQDRGTRRAAHAARRCRLRCCCFRGVLR